MITINKANPTPGEITSSLTGSTGDGAGLHFADNGYIDLANNAAAEFGTADFSIEFVLNQTGDNTSDNYIYTSHVPGNNRFYVWNDISDNKLNLLFSDGSGSATTKVLDYDMAADYGTPTHYVITFDRSGDATLYKNGNSAATVDISSTSAIDIGSGNANVGRLSAGTGYGVLGTFYRFRAFNTLADAKLLFERADVPQTLTANLLYDLDLAFANPTQSLTIQDRKGNTDGTASSSTAVTQVQPVVQGNLTSLAVSGSTARTPADGAITCEDVLVNTDSHFTTGGTPKVSINTTANALTFGFSDEIAYIRKQSGAVFQWQTSDSGSNAGEIQLQPYGGSVAIGANNALTIDSTGAVKIEQGGELVIDKAEASNGTIRFYKAGAASSYIQYDASENLVHYMPSSTGEQQFYTGGSKRLAISSTGHVSMTSSDAAAQLTITPTGTNANGIVNFIPPGTGRAIFQYGGTEAISFNNSGVTFSNGIAFSQTNSSATGATATGTTLDHFEEGTWTASLEFGGSTTGITYATNGQQGIYTRIGNMVYISCIVALTNKGSETGDARIGGLPFTVSDELAATSIENSFTSSYNTIGLTSGYAVGTTPRLYLRNSSYASLTNSDFSNTSSLRVSGWYTTP